ncbi:sugar porter family MFS transporter [Marinoscillum sp.]|uniref:sugar porter family MFS transporter n=1 Tax=Marinoscillum sp. TaxID=2024838 RepID=UPI003BAB5EA3
MNKFNTSYVLAIAFISALGGLLFGYDWVVIGGAKPFYELFFGIGDTPALQGWAISSALVGCIVGAIVAAFFSDKYGRKPLLIVAATLFVISAFGTGVTDDLILFIAYRILGGVGIGLASTLSPLYIAEIAPAKYRGFFVSLNQLTIVIGILAAQLVNFGIAEPVSDELSSGLITSWNVQTGWRWMFWAELVPAVFFFTCMLFVPESPRFLAKSHKYPKAKAVLDKIGGREYAEQQLEIIKGVLKKNEGILKLKNLLNSNTRSMIFIGIGLAVLQQWCGINVIFNYAEEIFTSAGYGMSDMLVNIVFTGSVNLIFTLVAMKTVDSLGRRKLMLLGSGGLAIIYVILGGLLFSNVGGWPILLLILMAIAVYAMSFAPVTWVLLSEIFPTRIRGLAMALATLFLWLASFLLTFTFPILNDLLGATGIFLIYALICLLGYIFIKMKIPETRNKSLEQIELELTEKN